MHHQLMQDQLIEQFLDQQDVVHDLRESKVLALRLLNQQSLGPLHNGARTAPTSLPSGRQSYERQHRPLLAPLVHLPQKVFRTALAFRH